ncbi:uncharacterized protein F4817DRAFT_328711, partial [Daldinia loculata]|uniref:uncharacterized protein n=1 Tax=Daldinia loculata TaxID=103429 RepID=UPI0020C43888
MVVLPLLLLPSVADDLTSSLLAVVGLGVETTPVSVTVLLVSGFFTSLVLSAGAGLVTVLGVSAGLLIVPGVSTGLLELGLGPALELGVALELSLLTGHTVVVRVTSLVTAPTGQLVTVAAHEVIVYVFVTLTTLVVYSAGALAVGVGSVLEPSDLVTGQTVVPTEIILVV